MRRRKCLVWRTPSPPYAYGRLAGAAMGLLEWWRRNREQADANRRSVALNDDQVLIAQQVPELAGMSDVQGMAYVLEQIEDWNKICTPTQAATISGRLMALNESSNADGWTMT